MLHTKYLHSFSRFLQENQRNSKKELKQNDFVFICVAFIFVAQQTEAVEAFADENFLYSINFFIDSIFYECYSFFSFVGWC